MREARELPAETSPWYRNAWVWLIIAIPAATIVGCLFTIWLALANPDELVREPVPASAERDAT